MCEVFSQFWGYLNSNFSVAFFGAIAGSVAGSFTIVIYTYYFDKRRALSDVNAASAVLGGLLNTLLNMKRQFVVPLVDDYNRNVETVNSIQTLSDHGVVPSSPVTINYTINLKKFHCPPLVFDITHERIFSLSSKNPAFVQILMQAKKSYSEVEHICGEWNKMAEELKHLPEDRRKNIYFGKMDSAGVKNTIYHDSIMNIVSSVDDGLYFTNRSLQELDLLARSSLPFLLLKKLCKLEFLDKEHADLMPPTDYKKGW